MKRKSSKKVLPIYFVAALWLIWANTLPLYNFSHYLWLAFISFIIFTVAKQKVKKTKSDEELAEEEAEKEEARAKEKAEKEKKKRAEEEKKKAEEEAAKAKAAQPVEEDVFGKPLKKRPRTGDAAIDKMLDDEERAIRELRRLDDAIPDEKLSAQIVHLEEVTTRIVNYVVENPSKQNQVRKFFTYYLPTTIKLLNAYDRMDETGISGMNIDGTKGKVEEMMNTALSAFDKQLDALYADEALDISTDIKVMESMLSQEGLTDDGLQTMMK